MKVALLCGGKGMRWNGSGEGGPKALAMIGDRPIVWHVMDVYSRSGFRDFVLCLGHLGQTIVDYFEREAGQPLDKSRTLELGPSPGVRWRVELVDTGAETQTGGRLRAVAPRLGSARCMVSYGDGVAAIDVGHLLEFHVAHGRLATLTAVQPRSQFGVLELGEEDHVRSFVEKPRVRDWVNGGFFVFEPGVLPLLGPGPLENGTLSRLAGMDELVAYRSESFWACVDTYKDKIELDELAREGRAPWVFGPGVSAAS
ncbi:MAG: NTP transferase domain-containing protein [Candidatus Dormibacteraeota bacterium]|nr:NTP transferase domain-containing protein [Candidatus Dormibacteraeota bacterium]